MCEIALLSLISGLYVPPSQLLSSTHILFLALLSSHAIKRMMNTQFSKRTVAGGPVFLRPNHLTHIFSHTHTHAERFRWCQDKWTQMLCPAVQAVLRLKKSCIMTSNFRTETECLCAESSVVTLFPLLSLSFLYLWQNLWCFAKFLFFFYVALGCSN